MLLTNQTMVLSANYQLMVYLFCSYLYLLFWLVDSTLDLKKIKNIYYCIHFFAILIIFIISLMNRSNLFITLMIYNSHLKASFDGYVSGHGIGKSDEHIALLFGCSKFPPILYSVHCPEKC